MFSESGRFQSNCIQDAIGNNPIISRWSLDVDQDGDLDEVIVYGDSDLFFLIVDDVDTNKCKIAFNEYLIFRKLSTGLQEVKIRNLEQIELTGDNIPELHLWVEKTGGGPRDQVALHAIYSYQEGNWKVVYAFAQCLAFNTFNFRTRQNTTAKDIYVDEDRHCEPPWSSGRTYDLIEWNGSRFVTIESGAVPNAAKQIYPDLVDYACLVPLSVPIVILLWLVWVVLRKKMSRVS